MLTKVTSVTVTDNLPNIMAYCGEKGLSHVVIQGTTLAETLTSSIFGLKW